MISVPIVPVYQPHQKELVAALGGRTPVRCLFDVSDAYVASLLADAAKTFGISCVLEGQGRIRNFRRADQIIEDSPASVQLRLMDFLSAIRVSGAKRDAPPQLLWLRTSQNFLADAQNSVTAEVLLLREIGELIFAQHAPHRVLITGHRGQVHAHLDRLWKVIDLSSPRGKDFEDFVGKVAENYGVPLRAPRTYAQTLRGVDAPSVASIMGDAMAAGTSTSNVDLLSLVKKERDAHLKRSSVIEVIASDRSAASVGGLEVFKRWLDDKGNVFSDLEGARRFGVTPPRGVLLAGVPGCGKSLMAKVVAAEFNLPLFRLDAGSLMAKFVGESEARLRSALEAAEAAAPCVLWIDEIEKGLKSSKGGDGGGGEVTSRLIGALLTWMQDRTADVFLVATANAVEALPPELLRRGRFDDFFYFGLPTVDERETILERHVTRGPDGRPRAMRFSDKDARKIAEKTESYSSADLVSLVEQSIEDVWLSEDDAETTPVVAGPQGNESRVLNFATVEKVMSRITPYGRQWEDEVKNISSRLKKHDFRNASLSADQKAQPTRQRKNLAKLSPPLQALARKGTGWRFELEFGSHKCRLELAENRRSAELFVTAGAAEKVSKYDLEIAPPRDTHSYSLLLTLMHDGAGMGWNRIWLDAPDSSIVLSVEHEGRTQLRCRPVFDGNPRATYEFIRDGKACRVTAYRDGSTCYVNIEHGERVHKLLPVERGDKEKRGGDDGRIPSATGKWWFASRESRKQWPEGWGNLWLENAGDDVYLDNNDEVSNVTRK